MNKEKRVFVVGLSKSWVQLRVSDKPPKAITTKVVRKANFTEPELKMTDDGRFYYADVPYTKELKIEVTYWQGGRSLGNYNFNKLWKQLLMGGQDPKIARLSSKTMFEVAEPMATILKSARWRNKTLS